LLYKGLLVVVYCVVDRAGHYIILISELSSGFESFLLLLDLGGGSSVELGLLLRGLESTVSELAGSIDELEGDLFVGESLDLGDEGLSQNEDFLLGSDAASLDHDEVVVDDSVEGETSHGGDLLIGQVGIGGSVVLLSSLTDSVHLLVDFSSVVIT